jgi:hypothetical protein
MFASSEHAWDPMASPSANFCRKTRTAPLGNDVPDFACWAFPFRILSFGGGIVIVAAGAFFFGPNQVDVGRAFSV